MNSVYQVVVIPGMCAVLVAMIMPWPQSACMPISQ